LEIVSDRRYTMAADVGTVWAALAGVDAYQRWWPWLRAFDASCLCEADVWRCTVRPPLPYTLRLTVSLLEVVQPALIRARVGGDVAGHAAVRLSPVPGGCEVRLTSRLAPARRSFAVVAAIARPAAVWAHDRVLDRGAAQFVERALGATPGSRTA
jgi:uncharacterized protein YndB with AHSA1/START domain